jgi:hypothetical protein
MAKTTKKKEASGDGVLAHLKEMPGIVEKAEAAEFLDDLLAEARDAKCKRLSKVGTKGKPADFLKGALAARPVDRRRADGRAGAVFQSR